MLRAMFRRSSWLIVPLVFACSEDDVASPDATFGDSTADAGFTDATQVDSGVDAGAVDSGLPDFDDQIAARLAAQAVPVTALAPPPAVAQPLYDLGRALFFDPILSGNMDVACASCHHPQTSSGDALSLSVGTGATGVGVARAEPGHPPFIPRHALDLFNRGDPSWTRLFWDGRVEMAGGMLRGPAALPMGLSGVLAAQALFPLLDRSEMRGADGDTTVTGAANELAVIANARPDAIWAAIVARVIAIADYVTLFAAAYPNVAPANLSITHVANAIAAFETRAFAFTDTPWDRYLRGDRDALNDAQKLGVLLFYAEDSCSTCHAGPLLSDHEFHNTGIPQIGPGQAPEAPFDHGRQRVSGDVADHFAFRTPPLRNVLLTAPYMHNGSLVDLNSVLRHYADPLLTVGRLEVVLLHPDLRTTVQTSTVHVADLHGSLSADLMLAAGTTTFVGLSNLRQFLGALTDPAAADLSVLVPATVPSGLTVPGR